jgi:hypothetical protein
MLCRFLLRARLALVRSAAAAVHAKREEAVAQFAHAREVDPLSISAEQAALVPLASQNDQGLEVAKNYSVSESVLRTRHGVSVSVIITDRIKASVPGCCGVDMTGWSVQIR